MNASLRGPALLLASCLISLAAEACPPLLDHRVATLRGEPEDLCRHAGKVVLVVNTASYCGYTPQYQGLESVYQKYRERGLVVLGFPSNDFGRQEPGSNAEVADFCERTYRVRFPMYEKSVVSGADASPVHRALAKAAGEAPRWNFHKYLIARDGRLVASWPSKVAPEDTAVVGAIELALGRP